MYSNAIGIIGGRRLDAVKLSQNVGYRGG